MLSFFLQFHEKELGKNQEQYRFCQSDFPDFVKFPRSANYRYTIHKRICIPVKKKE